MLTLAIFFFLLLGYTMWYAGFSSFGTQLTAAPN